MGFKGYMGRRFWLGGRYAPNFGTVTFSVSLIVLAIRPCPRRLGRRRRQWWPPQSSGKLTSYFAVHLGLSFSQVTISQAVFRGMPWGQAFLYMLMQLLGALVGAALVYANYYHAINAFEGGSGVRDRPWNSETIWYIRGMF